MYVFMYVCVYVSRYVYLSLSLSFSPSLFICIDIHIYIYMFTHVRNIVYALSEYLQVSACMGSMMYASLRRYPQVTTCMK